MSGPGRISSAFRPNKGLQGIRHACTSLAYTPVFYRETVRVPHHQREFPIWMHGKFERTIFPARRRDPQLSDRRSEGARDTEQQLLIRRLPKWKSVLEALQSNPTKICREQYQQRRLRSIKRLRTSQFADANLILDPILSLSLRNRAPDDQRSILMNAAHHHLSHWVSADEHAPLPHEALLPAGANLLIKRCISIHQLDLAEEILKLYSQAIHDIDISTQNKYRLATPYNTLLAYHVQHGNAAHCQTLLAQMLEKGIEPNSRTFHYLISSVEPGNIQAAFQMLEHMKSRKLRVSLDTLSTVLSKCLSEGRTWRFNCVRTTFAQTTKRLGLGNCFQRSAAMEINEVSFDSKRSEIESHSNLYDTSIVFIFSPECWHLGIPHTQLPDMVPLCCMYIYSLDYFVNRALNRA
ncbi:hypothetical protein DFS34DRAFT_422416 [Phlyctochytrium arcticum]|nr:hypothetical protein DFS34DRAFT_422416 [Phlyctochytrium arcticum]